MAAQNFDQSSSYNDVERGTYDPIPPKEKMSVKSHLKVQIIGIVVIVVMAVIVVAVVGNKQLSSFITSIVGQQSPSQLLASVTSRFNTTQSLQVNYSASFPTLSSSLGYLTGGNQSLPIQLTKIGKNTKVLITLGSYGALAIYHIGIINVLCSQYAFYSYSSTSIKCLLINSSAASSSTYNIFNPRSQKAVAAIMSNTLSYNGTQSINGRTCSGFLNVLNASQLSQLISALNLTYTSYSITQSLSGSGKLRILQCYDSQYGYLAYLNVSQSSYSALSGKNTTTVFLVLKATGVTTNVDPSLLKVPVSFAIQNISCNSSVVNLAFASLTNSSNATVAVTLNRSTYNYTPLGGYAYVNHIYTGSATVSTSGLSFGKTYSALVNIRSNNPAPPSSYSFYARAGVCVAGSCQNTTCYSYTPYSTISIPTITTSVSTTSTIPAGYKGVNISVTASDSSDSYLRYWEIFIDTPPGKYSGNAGIYANTSNLTYVEFSGSTMVYNTYLKPGTHKAYFVVTQTGGSTYGTYSGNMTINSKRYPFSGLNAYNYANVTFTV